MASKPFTKVVLVLLAGLVFVVLWNANQLGYLAKQEVNILSNQKGSLTSRKYNISFHSFIRVHDDVVDAWWCDNNTSQVLVITYRISDVDLLATLVKEVDDNEVRDSFLRKLRLEESWRFDGDDAVNNPGRD